VTARLPPPFPIRLAAGLLWLAGGLALLSGLATTALLALVPMVDPTLPGGWTLGLTVGALGLAVTLGGGALFGAAASGLGTGQPAHRTLATVLGVLLCLTPALPVGAWLLFLLHRSIEAVPWFETMAAITARERPASA
jgi:hypothetical protein